MPLSFPTLSAGDPVDNLELDANFADLVDMLKTLAADNLADDAGIVSSQLADRFCIVPSVLLYFPRVGASATAANLIDLSSGTTLWTMPNVVGSPGEPIDAFPGMILRNGRAAYLAAATARAQDILAGAGPSYPQVTLSHNGTVLGGGPLSIQAADTDYTMAAMNPYDSRQRSMQTGDLFTVGFGRSAAAAPTMRNLVLILYWFIELSGG